MTVRRFSRRKFLRLGAATGAGLALAGCAQPTTPSPTAVKPTETVTPEGKHAPVERTPIPEPTPTPAPTEEPRVTLQVRATHQVYEAAEQEIWTAYEAENPDIKIQVFSVAERQEEAYSAKLVSGYVPAIGWGRADQGDYEAYVNLLDIEFAWWDRFEFDVQRGFEQKYGIPGVYTLDTGRGTVITWQYQEELMKDAGLNPRRSVKTWDDLKAWLAEGAAWAESNPNVDRFWDLGWDGPMIVEHLLQAIPLAFPDGQYFRQRACWTGTTPFNAEDSPYRHVLAFFKEATDEGWLPEEWWTRSWEADVEAGFVAKRSAVLLSGPGTWNKVIPMDASANQAGIPATPPAEDQSRWVQYMGPLPVDSGNRLWQPVLEWEEWPVIQDAFNWWFSPPVVERRAEVENYAVLYTTDEPVEIDDPQWEGIVKEIGTPEGAYEDIAFELSPHPIEAATRYRIKDTASPREWDWLSAIEELMTGDADVQDALDWLQEQWAASYSVA